MAYFSKDSINLGNEIGRVNGCKGKNTEGGFMEHTKRECQGAKESTTYLALKDAVLSLYRFDDFDKEVLGNGFFSDVYKVTHKISGQVLVLKMNNSIKNRPNMLREVQLLNRLSHPNILKYKGACVHEGVLHALTEFVNGGSLESVLADKTRELDWPVRMRFAVDIARGMRYLHSRGFMHRDLTSKNILVRIEDDYTMTAIVADFGLAWKIPDPWDANAKALPIVGSPYWMAPECINCQPYSEKADIFSFGIILCEIIARVEADPDFLPRTSNFGLDYVQFSNMAKDCPIHFLTLAYNCCQYDPKKRPTFNEICERMEEVKSRSQMATVLADITNMNLIEEHIYRKTILDRILIGKGLKRHMSDEAIMIHVPFDDEDIGMNTSDDRAEISDFGDEVEERSSINVFVTPPSTGVIESSPKTIIPVTAQFVGEVMSKDDPFYTPCKDNPFTSRFKDARAKLIGSLRDNWASCFEMPSPHPPRTPPSSPLDYDESKYILPIAIRIRRCHSLPGSPSMARREMDRYQYEPVVYSSARRTVSVTQNLRNVTIPAEEASIASGPSLGLTEWDRMDTKSDGGSSNDSALGMDMKRLECRQNRVLQRTLYDFRKQHLDPYRVTALMDKYMFMTRSIESRVLGDALHNSKFCYSSSESFNSLDESALISPTSSFSSYSETDSDLGLSRVQRELIDHRLRSRQRFQELLRKFEAKHHQTAQNSAANEGDCSGACGVSCNVSRPDPRDIFSKYENKYEELRHKWEAHLAEQNSSSSDSGCVTRRPPPVGGISGKGGKRGKLRLSPRQSSGAICAQPVTVSYVSSTSTKTTATATVQKPQMSENG